MNQIIRTAIIGTGKLSTKRIYPYLSSAGMRVQAVTARHIEHAQEKCDLYSGKAYSDWRVMIETENPDAVIACVGPELHYEAAMFCLEHHIPIYTEKPPASNPQEIENLLQRSKENRTLYMTGFKKRYSACYIRAKEWLAAFPENRWECFSLDWYVGKFDLEKNPKETVLLDFAIHAIDLVTWLFGKTEKVSVFSKGWDSFAIVVQMYGGVVGNLTISDHRSFAHPGEEMEITVAGGNAMTIHNSSSWQIQTDGVPTEWFEPPTCLAGGDSGYNTGMLKELEVFAETVRSGESPTENIETSLETFRLYEAIRDSIRQDGTLIRLPRQ